MILYGELLFTGRDTMTEIVSFAYLMAEFVTLKIYEFP